MPRGEAGNACTSGNLLAHLFHRSNALEYLRVVEGALEDNANCGSPSAND